MINKNLRAEYPNDDAVPDKRRDHKHCVNEGKYEMVVLADGGEAAPVRVNHRLVLLRDVPAHHVLNHFR